MEYSNKVYTIFAGINGAGKSTLYHSLNEDFGVRVNMDERVVENGGDWRSLKDQYKAAREVLEIQRECLEKGISFNRETTVGGIGVLRSIEQAKKLGYKIQLYFVGVEKLDIAKTRVKSRVKRGGHGIDEGIMNARYDALDKGIIEIIKLSDSVKLFDNSYSFLEMVAYLDDGKFTKISNYCKWLDKLLIDYEKSKSNQMQNKDAKLVTNSEFQMEV